MTQKKATKKPLWLKFVIGAMAAAFLTGFFVTLALRFLVPKDKAQALLASQVEKALNREVRIGDIDITLFKGLVIKNLEVSEKPDFKAGVFGGVKSFELKVDWIALLSKKIVVDRVVLNGPFVTVILGKDGKFNFSDLIEADPDEKPAPKKDPPAEKPPLDLELKVSKTSIIGGTLVYKDLASGDSYTVSDLSLNAFDIRLDAPFESDLSLTLSGKSGNRRISATLSAASRIDLSGRDEGRLAIELEKFVLDLAGLTVSLSGAITADKTVLETDLKGTLAGGRLTVAVTIRDYEKAPKISLDLTLSRLDIKKFLDADAAMTISPPPKKKHAAKTKSPPIAAKGKILIAEITHPGFTAEKMSLTWDLKGITPKNRRLNGWSKLTVGPGGIKTLGAMSEQNKAIRVLAAPLIGINKIARFGGIKLLPDLSHVAFKSITGDFSVTNGLMRIDDFRLDGPIIKVRALGTVDIPQEHLNLKVTTNLAKVAPIKITVTGTFSDPKTKVNVAEILTSPAGKLLQPAGKILKGLFKLKGK